MAPDYMGAAKPVMTGPVSACTDVNNAQLVQPLVGLNTLQAFRDSASN